MERKLIMAEMSKQLALAGPLTLSNGLQFILQMMSLVFLSHLDEISLSGASIATAVGVVTGYSVMMGMSSAMDTLCGQAFGANHHRKLGIYMQRAMLILTLTSIPIAFIWVYAEKILIALHQDEQISAAAGVYTRWMIPSLFGFALLQCHIRFLQSQNIVWSSMLSSGVAALLHLLFCWLFVHKFSLGARGAAMALSISYWVNTFLLALYVKLSPKCRTTWTGLSKEALKEIPEFLNLAIPSAAMICLEFSAFEVILLLSGILPNPKLETSVMSINLNTCSTLYMIINGLGAAVSTRVSNELGAADPEAIRLVVYVAISMASVEGLILGLIMLLLRKIWGHAYSSNREVASHVAALMPLLALLHLVNGTQCVLSGIARGCGWQKIGAFISLGSFYAIGIPCSVILAFVAHLGLKGLWIGIIIALVLQDVLFTVITSCTVWEKEVAKVKARVTNSSIV